MEREIHNNIFYFVKRQMMLTWGQNSIKVPFRFRKLYLEKIYYCYHPFLYQYLICFCALFYSSSRSNFAFELVIFGVVCVQGMKKLPRSLLQDSVWQRQFMLTTQFEQAVNTRSKSILLREEKKGVLKRLEWLSNKFTAYANGNIYLSLRLILL